MFPFYTPWKYQKTKGFAGVFRGYKMGTLAGVKVVFSWDHLKKPDQDTWKKNHAVTQVSNSWVSSLDFF